MPAPRRLGDAELHAFQAAAMQGATNEMLARRFRICIATASRYRQLVKVPGRIGRMPIQRPPGWKERPHTRTRPLELRPALYRCEDCCQLTRVGPRCPGCQDRDQKGAA